MAEKLLVNLVLPERSGASVEAKAVSVPLIDGYATILPDHTNYLSVLGAGLLRLEQPSDGMNHAYFVSGGFIEVKDNVVNLLMDVSETVEQIDVNRAKAAQERAEQRLRQLASDVDVVRAQAALLRASSRLAAIVEAKLR